MIHMRIKRDPRLWSFLLAGVFVFSSEGRGGVVPPLYVGNRLPVLDEYGRPMRGSPRPAEAGNRCRVEIRTTTTGAVYAPGTNGAASPYNPLLATNSVGGMGANVETADSGLFCLSFQRRPAAGTLAFARVYDAPTVAEAAFYADTPVAAIPADGSSLALDFGAIRPLDPGDADGDGLNNSWERALGTADRPAADYDGDGMLDLNEMLAGTDPTDAASLLALCGAWTETNVPGYDPLARLLHVQWPAVPGKSYRLEAAVSPGSDPETGAAPVFAPLGDVVTAGADETLLDVWIDVSGAERMQVYRIRIAEAAEP